MLISRVIAGLMCMTFTAGLVIALSQGDNAGKDKHSRFTARVLGYCSAYCLLFWLILLSTTF